MTNYAFQGVGRTLKSVSALAIHLIKCAAKANCRLVLAPQPKGVGLVISRILPRFLYNTLVKKTLMQMGYCLQNNLSRCTSEWISSL